MLKAAEISGFASAALGVDLVARRIVVGLLNTSPKGIAVTASFSASEVDQCSFQVQCHRITLQFEFSHFISKHANREALAGRYDVFKVDREGEWVDCKAGFNVYPPRHLLFDDGTSFELSESPDVGDLQQLQNTIANLAFGIAQDNLERRAV